MAKYSSTLPEGKEKEFTKANEDRFTEIELAQYQAVNDFKKRIINKIASDLPFIDEDRFLEIKELIENL